MNESIKISLSGTSSSPSTGKGFFFYRLANCLRKKGVTIVEDSYKADVALHNTRVKHNNAIINVVRIDGVYHNNKQNYKLMNKKVFKGVHKDADGIIYQSNFSKKIADRFIGEFKRSFAIIPNGADPHFYSNIMPYERQYDSVFITVSRWRPHKRLRDIIESFLLAGLKKSILYVVGDLKQSGLTDKEKKKYLDNKSVMFLGVLDQKSLSKYLVSSDVFIHLCWLDNCPNSVVESICAGVPVITNNVGGTHEIVSKSGGYVVPIDNPYNLNPCDLYSPPNIDREMVSKIIIKASESNVKVSYSHVDIDNVAIEYKRFFCKIMGDNIDGDI
jgi:glycosyltransferase involved in cell wall biosynthesis